MEDLFLGGQSSIILGYRRLSVKSLLVWALISIDPPYGRGEGPGSNDPFLPRVTAGVPGPPRLPVTSAFNVFFLGLGLGL